MKQARWLQIDIHMHFCSRNWIITDVLNCNSKLKVLSGICIFTTGRNCSRLWPVNSHSVIVQLIFYCFTCSNQRLRSAGDNDRRSKCSFSNAMLCVSFTWQMVETRVFRLIEGPNARDLPVPPLILSGSPNKCWLHACDACVIRIWRLGMLTIWRKNPVGVSKA